VTSSQLTAHAVSAGGGVNLDFDATLFVQVAFVLFLWAVLKPLLFDPMLQLFEEREKRIEGSIKRARRIDEKSAEAKAEYDGVMSKARAEGTAEREKLRAEGLRKENDLLTKVRAEVQKTVDEAREATKKEADATRAALAPDTQTIAKDLAARLLGRDVR
jgi:F-type H+-transporting ATPase subunit b